MNDSVKLFGHDPVCLMDVQSDEYSTTYQSHQYVFCSEQCQQRFKTNPHLYVGSPGHKAPKYEIGKLSKKRSLKLMGEISKQQTSEIVQTLKMLMGVEDVYIENNCVHITYDLLQLTQEQIENKIRALNNIDDAWFEGIKRICTHYKEASELANLEQVTHKHCH